MVAARRSGPTLLDAHGLACGRCGAVIDARPDWSDRYGPTCPNNACFGLPREEVKPCCPARVRDGYRPKGDPIPKPPRLHPNRTPPACCEACERPVGPTGWGICGVSGVWLFTACLAASVSVSAMLFGPAGEPAAVRMGRAAG